MNSEASFSSKIQNALQEKYDGIDGEPMLREELPKAYQFLCDLLRDSEITKEYRPFLSGALGLLVVSDSVLEDDRLDLLSRVYLVGSIIRRMAQESGLEGLVDRHWPGGIEEAQETFSEIIRRGNDELNQRQIKRVFEYAGFEARG